MLKEIDQVFRDCPAGVVFGCVRLRLVRIIGLHNSYHSLGVDRNIWCSDAVFGRHNEVRFSSRGEIGHGDIVQTLEGRCGGVDFDNNLVGLTWHQHTILPLPRSRMEFYHLDDLRAGAHARAWDDASILGNGTRLHNRHIQPVVGFVHGIVAIHQVDGEHAQVLVEEFDPALVDAPRNVFAHLMRRPPLNHVQSRPPVLRLRARAGADKEVELQLALQPILLHVVGEGGGHLLGIAHAREAGPADVAVMREEVEQVFGARESGEVRGPPHARSEERRGGGHGAVMRRQSRAKRDTCARCPPPSVELCLL